MNRRISGTFPYLLESSKAIIVALAAFNYRATSAGFSDLMILATAERSGSLPLYTFDRKVARLEGATLLEGRLNGEKGNNANG